MGKTIYAEQTLHGYANGHQLLASSCALELPDRKRMDELSDLSGRHSGEGFVNYYTGYPIENGNKYVISKTWYASEMIRPGCVWTHSLIFNTKDLGQISDLSRLISSFQRPVSSSFQDYLCRILLPAEGVKLFPSFDFQRLQYAIFTICASATSKCVIANSNSTCFESELFMVLCSLPQEILSTFTFCTMSYDVRKYGDSLFQYQIIPNAVRNIPTRNYSNIMVCEEFSSIEKYPYWIQCYMQALLQDTLQDLYCFIRQYGTEYMTFTCYNHFARLYFALIGEMEISLTEYIESISMLFKSSQPLSQKTMELLLDNTFFPEVFINQEYQLLEIIEMKHLWPQKDWIKKLKCKIIHNTPEKLYPYMQRYIVGSLPVQICELVEDIIHELSPNHLRVVSHMDSNICFVLIRKNYNMLLCPDIWKQPRDFQQEILCAIGRTLEPELIKKLLVLILQTDVENIAEDMYRVLGNPLLPLLYDAICFARLIGEDQLRNWTPILLKDPNLLLDRILSLPESNWRQELFLQIDMNGEGFAQCVKKERWISLYQEFFKKETSICRQVDIAIQFFPAVFCTTYHFDDDFVRDVVGTVYREAKNNTMNSGVWSRFQHILPQVEDYQAWDRCLRIRRALDEKGYIVALIESVT